MVDFGTLPPEVNSARMYTGSGSSPLLAAASAWKELAAELRSTALSYGSVVDSLTGEEWYGPASDAMSGAAAPYVGWMSSTAAHAEQTAAQAEAAVNAYEAAFAATVPPPVITANRTQLASLVATNVLGQNTAAIAATEAHYGQMWAQDAAAMYSYAASSSSAATLAAFAEPPQTTTANAAASQSGAVSQAAASSSGAAQSTLTQLTSSVPSALQSLSTPAASDSGLTDLINSLGLDIFSSSSGQSTTGLAGVLNSLFSTSNGSALGNLLGANFWNTIFSSGFYMPGNFLGTAVDFMGMGGSEAQAAASDVAGAAAGEAAQAVPTALSEVGRAGSAVAAEVGRAPMIGMLSVPSEWTAAEPLPNLFGAALGGTPMQPPPPNVAAGMPGVPLATASGHGLGRATPQYGFRPNFVVRSPAAG